MPLLNDTDKENQDEELPRVETVLVPFSHVSVWNGHSGCHNVK